MSQYSLRLWAGVALLLHCMQSYAFSSADLQEFEHIFQEHQQGHAISPQQAKRFQNAVDEIKLALADYDKRKVPGKCNALMPAGVKGKYCRPPFELLRQWVEAAPAIEQRSKPVAPVVHHAAQAVVTESPVQLEQEQKQLDLLMQELTKRLARRQAEIQKLESQAGSIDKKHLEQELAETKELIAQFTRSHQEAEHRSTILVAQKRQLEAELDQIQQAYEAMQQQAQEQQAMWRRLEAEHQQIALPQHQAALKEQERLTQEAQRIAQETKQAEETIQRLEKRIQQAGQDNEAAAIQALQTTLHDRNAQLESQDDEIARLEAELRALSAMPTHVPSAGHSAGTPPPPPPPPAPAPDLTKLILKKNQATTGTTKSQSKASTVVAKKETSQSTLPSDLAAAIKAGAALRKVESPEARKARIEAEKAEEQKKKVAQQKKTADDWDEEEEQESPAEQKKRMQAVLTKLYK